MKCPNCQTEVPDSAKFCMACGRTLETELVCPRCDHANPAAARFCLQCGQPVTPEQASTTPPTAQTPPPLVPTAFASGRYQVKKFLGEGGKKKVYLAHDTVLDRDVAFYLIKTEKLDEAARTRIKREAQSMGRLGDHPNIVTIFDFGDSEGQPYMVAPLLPGGDIEGLIKKAPDHKLPLDRAVEIARSVCKGLEFAHAKGIIHRDIKPGNVLLSADGTAKIGDFGLAVAIDMSRLTGAGMMVGTVSYMPPEQAMGGQVTAKADLYSLGAMLYEMVTGRPPFIGDDSVAIIGQHINTPPISPTWHRADLPPALETLIMQLLEKDPDKRPQSATVVLQALEAIGASKDAKDTSAKDTSTKASTENPLYRRVFVGREAELKQLQSAFDGAMSGQGALMMVMGEPGIGKTALTEQLATYVTLRGGRTLVGHCYEEGSLSLPYLAFVEAMRSYVLDRDAGDLQKELGSGATDVARIVSEIRERLNVQPRQAENPQEDRYRLLQAVSSFLAHAAAVKPMLVILEDLHDADKGTLEMLSYISRNLAGARLLLVGTYRDVEVNRSHPLSAALADLRRASSFGRVLLRGLNADEVSRMLKSITQESVPWGLAEAVHRQTEGNPLFVQEVVRYLMEQKLLIRAGGKMIATGSTPLEMNIPEGLRDVIGKRLSNLSEACNRVLAIAAVIGREFRLDVLEAVSGLSEEEAIKSVEEAKRVAVVEERSALGGATTYRFAHAFFRTTLYEENIAPRRMRLHQQVARTLETIYGDRVREHAAELAEHFSYSTEPADLTKAVSYGEMAAQRAVDVFDYGEAARLLRQALKVQEVLDPADKGKRCDLLTVLGTALGETADYRHAADVEFPEALLLAEQIGDNRRAALACYRVCWAISRAGVVAYGSNEILRWVEAGDRYAGPDTIERAGINLWLGVTKCFRGLQNDGLPLILLGLEQARRFNDRELITVAGTMWVIFGIMPWSGQEAPRVAEELAAIRNVLGMNWAFRAFLACGQRRRAEDVRQTVTQIAAMTADFSHAWLAMDLDARLAFLDGRLEENVDILTRMVAYGEENGMPGPVNNQAMNAGIRAMMLLGYPQIRPDSALWRVVMEVMEAPAHRRMPLLLAYLGQVSEARQRLDRTLKARPDMASRNDLTQAWIDIVNLEGAVMVGHRQAAEILLKRFAGNTLSLLGLGWETCIARQLGGAAALLGRYDEARRHYQEAIRVCTEMRFRPELALSRLQLAELLLEHFPDEKKDALEHLDFAIKEFREMKMQPSLERALRHKEILKA